MPEGPLTGLTVIDLSEHIPGPYCARMLADYGATVIKVEPPNTGDRARHLRPFQADVPHPERSGLFLLLNSNKKGVTLNIETSAGRRLFKDLIQQADLLVEDRGQKKLGALGLDFASLERLNPRLVVTSISDFGEDGPYQDYRMTSIVAHAMGGYMYRVGDPDKPPLQPGSPYAMFMAGLLALNGSLIAILNAQIAGSGQHVEVSVLEAAVFTLIYDTVAYSYTGQVRTRAANMLFPGSLTLSLQPAADGHVGFFLGQGMERWQLLWNALLERPDILEDERWAAPRPAMDGIDELEAIIQERLADRNAEDVFHEAQSLRFLFGFVADIERLLKLPQLEERDYFVQADHPATGMLTYPGTGFRFDGQQAKIASSAPLLGQHNREVFCDRLGYSAADLARLRAMGVI